MITPRFLLDTNILSEPTKLMPNPRVLQRLTNNLRDAATASVVYHELKFGWATMKSPRQKQEMGDYIRRGIEDTLAILPYCEVAAGWHAVERARLVRRGKTPPYMDGQIAAIAIANNLTLVTRNVKDFKNFQDLKIENWFE